MVFIQLPELAVYHIEMFIRKEIHNLIDIILLFQHTQRLKVNWIPGTWLLHFHWLKTSSYNQNNMASTLSSYIIISINQENLHDLIKGLQVFVLHVPVWDLLEYELQKVLHVQVYQYV